MWSCSLEIQGELMLQLKSKDHLQQNSLLLGGDQSFVLFRPSTDYTRPTQGMEDNLLPSDFH